MLHALGEVAEEEVGPLQGVLRRSLSAASAAERQQAAQVWIWVWMRSLTRLFLLERAPLHGLCTQPYLPGSGRIGYGLPALLCHPHRVGALDPRGRLEATGILLYRGRWGITRRTFGRTEAGVPVAGSGRAVAHRERAWSRAGGVEPPDKGGQVWEAGELTGEILYSQIINYEGCPE